MKIKKEPMLVFSLHLHIVVLDIVREGTGCLLNLLNTVLFKASTDKKAAFSQSDTTPGAKDTTCSLRVLHLFCWHRLHRAQGQTAGWGETKQAGSLQHRVRFKALLKSGREQIHT